MEKTLLNKKMTENFIIKNNEKIEKMIKKMDNKIEKLNEKLQTIIFKKNEISNNIIKVEKKVKTNKIGDFIFTKIIDAINYRIENKLSNYILLSNDIKKNEAYKQYILINENKKINYIESDKNAYEILLKYDETQNYKLYLDIDKDISKKELTDINNDEINYLNKFIKNGEIDHYNFYIELIEFINKLINYIKNVYNYDFENNNDDIYNQIYVVKSQSITKISYHIIFNNIIFKHINHMKYFMKNMIHILKDENLIKYNYIDVIPYMTNQNLRLINNTKIGKNNKLVFCENHISKIYEKIENNNIKLNDFIQDYKLKNKINTFIITNKDVNINIDIDEYTKITISKKDDIINNKIIEKKEKKEIINNNDDNIKGKFNIEFSDIDIIEINNLIDDKIILNKIIDIIKPLNKSKYNIWFYIIKAIKILTNDINLYEDFNGNFHNKTDNINIWNNLNFDNNIKEKFESIYSLFIHLQKLDINYYNEILNKYKNINNIIKSYNSHYNIKFPINFYKIDDNLINEKIILKKEDLTNENNKYFLNKDIIINAYNNNYNNIIIKSGLGTGKSVSVCNFLAYYLKNKNKNASILIISPRISYSNSINQTLENELKIKFDIYNDSTIKINDSNRLILSVFSLARIERNYDIIVLDEIESIINVFKSKECHIDYLKNYNIFYDLIKNSLVNLFLDGDINNSTLKLCNDIKNKNSILYINNINFKKRNVNIYTNLSNIENKLNEDIKNKKKIVIFHYSKNKIINLKKIYELNYPDKKIIVHYSGSKDNNLLEKKDDKNNFISINNIWDKADILIYNSSITVGIDFNKNYFDKVYIFNDLINLTRDVIQSINRIRYYKDDEINLYNPHKGKNDCEDEILINIFNEDQMENLINDVIKDELFINEYNSYIDNNNDYNKIVNNGYIDNCGIDYNLIKKNDNYKDGKIISDYMNMKEYFKNKYSNMSELMKILFNRSFEEHQLNKKYSNSFFIYFFLNNGYNINIINEKLNISKNSEEEDEIYKICEDLYNECYENYFGYSTDECENKIKYMNDDILLKYIIENQKNHNKLFKHNDDYNKIKTFIIFNKKYNVNEFDNINKVFKFFMSSTNIKYFRRYNEYINDISVYDKINNKLKLYNCIEVINKNEYILDEIRTNILKLSNINKDNINKVIQCKKNDIKIAFKYIEDNIEKIKEITEYKNIYNDNKNNKNLLYVLYKNIIKYYNIDVSYVDKKHAHIHYNPDIIFNTKNILSYIDIKKEVFL